jgi:hypothetical protein
MSRALLLWGSRARACSVALTILLVLLCLCASGINGNSHAGNHSGHGFRSVDRFLNQTIAENPELFRLLDAYVHAHSRTAMHNDPNFCDRKFVIGVYACPQAMGNHLHEFLNSFAAAFITNR